MTSPQDTATGLQKKHLRSTLRQVRIAHVRERGQAALRQDHEALARHAASLLAMVAAKGPQDSTPPVIASFKAKGSEIDPTPLEQALRAQGARLVWPRVQHEGLRFHADDASPAFVTGSYGLLEPPLRATEWTPHLVLLPLVGFDAQGRRLGQGGGYYDRALHRLGPLVPAIGLAYECQRCEQIPAEAHDVAMRGVITPAGLQLF